MLKAASVRKHAQSLLGNGNVAAASLGKKCCVPWCPHYPERPCTVPAMPYKGIYPTKSNTPHVNPDELKRRQRVWVVASKKRKELLCALSRLDVGESKKKFNDNVRTIYQFCPEHKAEGHPALGNPNILHPDDDPIYRRPLPLDCDAWSLADKRLSKHRNSPGSKVRHHSDDVKLNSYAVARAVTATGNKRRYVSSNF